MTENKIIYACEVHIETALDDYVNIEEKAPRMNTISDGENIKCSYCEKQADYVLLP